MATQLELYHHGVKGMKWGIRKDRYTSNGNKRKRRKLNIREGARKVGRSIHKFAKAGYSSGNDPFTAYSNSRTAGRRTEMYINAAGLTALTVAAATGHYSDREIASIRSSINEFASSMGAANQRMYFARDFNKWLKS